jgi:CheY-like chemotaxis protein
MLVLMLQKAGHEVRTADNGLDAIALATRERFDAVLMDIQMPGMNGLDATRAIRAHEAGTGRHMPILAVTAHALSGDATSCRDAGADEYLRKPVNLTEMMAILERLIERESGEHDLTT